MPQRLVSLLAVFAFLLLHGQRAHGQRYPGLVSLTVESSGKCIDIPGSSPSATGLVQFACHSGDNQRFRILESGNNSYSLTAAHSGLCMDITGSSRSAGAVVQQWPCNSTDAQRFALRDAGGGSFRLEAVVSGLCVEIENGSLADEARIVQNACGDKPSQRFSLTPMTFRPKPDLPVATVGREYSYTFGAVGATPYRFSVASGNLPAGLSLASSGLLSGSPADAGSYTFTVNATDSNGKVLTDSVKLAVGAPAVARVTTAVVARAPILNTCTPPEAESEFLTTDPTVWVVAQITNATASAGERGGFEWLLPNGDVFQSLSIPGSGCYPRALSIAGGPPSQLPGTWRIRMVWNGSEVFSLPFRISVPATSGTLNFLSSTLLPRATAGAPYSFTFTGNGGSPPYTWSLTSGNLPEGLSLSSGGVLSGTPSQVRSSVFSIRLQDSAGASLTRRVGLPVEPPVYTFQPSSLTFNYRRGDPSPASQTVMLRSGGVSVPFRTGIAHFSGGNWLTVSPSTGTTPDTLTLTVNPGTLGPGTYRASVSAISSITFSGLPVTLVVEDPLPPGQFRPLITTYAGADWVFPFRGSVATNAPIGPVDWITVDAQNQLLASDRGNHIVIRRRKDGSYETVAGNGILGLSGDGGPATSASLNTPSGLAVDALGNVYFCDTGNHRVRRVSPDGIITTISGSRAGFGGDGGLAVYALLNTPRGLALGPDGSIYISDTGNNVIRRITRDGLISTYAGSRQPGSTGDGGPATAGSISPHAMTFGPDGSLYFAEFDDHRVRRVTRDGILLPVAGNGTRGYSGDNGQATAAALANPSGIAFDATGNLYISEYGNFVIRRVSPDGIIRPFAGSRTPGFSPDGTPAADARFMGTTGLSIDSAQNIYVGDQFNFRVRVVDSGLHVSTVLGSGGYRNPPDGAPLSGSFFNAPRGLAFDPDGNLIVVDLGAQRIRRLDADGTFHTIAGSGTRGTFNNLAALETFFLDPVGVVVNSSGSVFVADTLGHRIRRIDGDRISTIAGSGSAAFGGDGGPAGTASLNRPHGLALDAAGNLYIADEFNHRIRRITPSGTISTVVGTGTAGSTGDNGQAAEATLRNPFAVAFDRTGNMYIAESQGHVVRRVDTGGIITTIAGTGRAGFGGDGGPARSALLNAPAALAFDASGNLYIGERDGHRVRRIDTSGVITSIAGIGVSGFSGDGGRADQAALNGPNGGLAVDSSGNLYISDTGNNRIRVVTARAVSLQTSATSLSFRASSNGPASEGQTLAITGSNLGLPYSVAARTTSGGSWLRVSPTSGTLPTSISIYADPTNTAAGTYNGTLIISVPNATPITVAVTLTVAAANPPKLGYDPGSVSFSVPENGLAEQVLFVSNLGGGALAFDVAQASVAWLTAAPLATATGGLATCPNCTLSSGGGGGVRLAVSARGLAPGTYRTSVALSNAATKETVQVPLILTVTPSGRPSMRVSQTGLTFRLIAGYRATVQCFAVLNLGQGSLDFGVSADSPWINVKRAPCPYRAVSSPSPIPEVVVEMVPDGLAAGDYEGQIQVSASNAENPRQDVAVKLRVLPPGSALGPDIFPTGLVFSSVAGRSTPGSLGVVVNNISERPFEFYSNSGFETASWFSYQPRSGVVRPTAPGEQGTVVTVQPDTSNLGTGLYYGFLTLATREYGGRVVNALLALGDGSGGKSTRAAGACPEGSVSLLHTAAAQDFVATAGQPFPIEVYATDGCGGPLTTGSVIATFSNGDPAVTMSPIGDGRWAGTWIPGAGGAPLTITVLGSDGAVTGQLPLIGRVQ